MKTLKLFGNGQSQAVRLPKEFRLPGHKVQIKKIGQTVVLIPPKKVWDSLKESLTQFSKDFMTARKQPKIEGRTQRAELHWYEAHGIGKKRMKIERFQD